MKNLKNLTLFFALFWATHLSAQQNNNAPTTIFSTPKNSFKTSLLSPFSEHLDFSYERAFNNRYRAELKFGIIGVGLGKHETQTVYNFTSQEEKIPLVSDGYFFEGGLKYFFNPPTSSDRPKLKEGFYFKPSLIFGQYRKNLFTTGDRPEGGIYVLPTNQKSKVTYQALLLNVGVHFHLTKKLFLDFYAAGGIGNDNQRKVKKDDAFLYFGEFHRGVYKSNGGTSFAGKIGLNLGFNF